MTRGELRQWVARAVVAACEEAVSVDDLLRGQESLTALGVTSLAYLRLVDTVEAEYGVYIDLDADVPDTVDEFVDRLAAAGVAGDEGDEG